jgi:hypothetical protein
LFDGVRDLMRTNRSQLFQFASVVVRFDHVSAEQAVSASGGENQ